MHINWEKFFHNFLFLVAFLYMIIACTYFGLQSKTTEMGLSILIGAICMSFANLDKIKKFKGAGFEAEMRELVTEGTEIINHMRALAVKLTSPILNLIGIEGEGFQHLKYEEKIEIRNDLLNTLEELNISNKQLKTISHIFDKSFIIEHNRKLLGTILRDSSITEKVKNEIKDLFPINNLEKVNIEKVKDILENHNYLKDEINELILDSEYFIQHKKLRRSEKWLE